MSIQQVDKISHSFRTIEGYADKFELTYLPTGDACHPTKALRIDFNEINTSCTLTGKIVEDLAKVFHPSQFPDNPHAKPKPIEAADLDRIPSEKSQQILKALKLLEEAVESGQLTFAYDTNTKKLSLTHQPKPSVIFCEGPLTAALANVFM